ncbi:MAG: hypothetical protein FD176_2645 [Rhodospirillaceae bacterium]|nr:MAG: hypothetical protein FD176_2645 [Rhodospirillaceae bacterium]TNC96359.1 MAG: hypothetical protein FD119_1666 [Stygiobacter sp.]
MAPHWRIAAISPLLALLLPASALAEPNCDISQFTSVATAFQKGVVSGGKGGRAYFHNGGDGCPSEACRRKAYVIAGDIVLVGSTSTDWTCVAFVGAKGAITGWIAKDQLALTATNPNPSLAAWGGEWKSGRNSLSIQAQNGGSISVDGLALWGDGPAPRTGEVQGAATPAGVRASVKDGACQVTLTLADDWLIASDNQQCGGLNVTFSGVYRR